MLIAQASRASAGGRAASHEILVTDPEIADRRRGRALPDGRGRGALRGRATSAYGAGPPVLDGLDLTIRGGEAVALVGATGSGKTTVARLLPRFYDVDAGRVLLDGVDVRDARAAASCGSAVGIVFEDTFLFSDTVRENIAFADPEAPMDAGPARGARSPAPTTSSTRCPTATTPSSASTGSRCRVGSASASRSRARCSPTRGC